ncbi:PREDICTED: trans-1,2-dihydrobenzene-1,2-diol dehydrogenase-like isoform X2 [Dinoponera quadriceps]|uniref:Trans-1,2-dihydrobenzene-1,2-diol dehydrogenase n=1 Tax=Dinoponera quadriceps TaxID=609295 RepID=A0A6P3WTH3_DINQU|nr:PREDICTED: trans-1,2-dihydrobenzene-1,2-diol dehydrogenase-like isoform X2 [Dinoponera quadriceps]
MAIRWGIASAGKISHDFVTAMTSLPIDEHIVIAVAARDLSRAEEFAQAHNILKAYDIVYIGAIHTQHYNLAMMMLSEGKHVLCEKPMTMSLADTTKLISYAKSKNLFLMEGVWSRFFPIYDTLRNIVETNEIGDIHHVFANFGVDLQDVDRLIKKELGGGTLLDLGVYCLQFATLCFGNEMPESITASGFLNEEGVDICMSACLNYKGNRSATITSSSLVKLPNRAIMCGTKNLIEVPSFWCATTLNAEHFNTVMEQLPKVSLRAKFNFINSAGLAYEIAEARNCILKGLIESPKMTHEDSLTLAKLENEILKQLGVQY